MTIFEKRFLSCRRDPDSSTPSCLDGLAFSPGPLGAPEPLYSDDVRGIEEYPEEEVVDSLASIDGVCWVRDGRDSAWAYRWSRGDRSIDIVRPPGEDVEEDGETIWLGSRLRTNCTFADVVRLWNGMRAHHPAIWLINSAGQMFTPQSFLEECALPALCRATTDEDTASRDLADESFSEYSALAGTTRRHDARWRQAAAHMSASAFALRWPVLEFTGSAPLDNCLNWKVRQLDHALAEAGVPYYAYPTMRGGSRRGIAVWAPRSDADVACSIMGRLELIEPSHSAEDRVPAVQSDMRGPFRHHSQIRE